MSFPSNDARRRHELVLTAQIEMGMIYPFSVDLPHVYEVRSQKAPRNAPRERLGDRVPATSLANYRVMVELFEMTPGKRFSKNRAYNVKKLLQEASKPLGLTTSIEILGKETMTGDGESVREPNHEVVLPADHGFVVSVRDKNGAAEEILKLEKANPEDRISPVDFPEPKSKAEAKRNTREVFGFCDHLLPYFAGRVFDKEKAFELGAVFREISYREFTAKELFDLTDSLEHRVHRKFTTDDIVTLAKSIEYFSDQGYKHEDVLRLARVAATIQGPVLCFRGNFVDKKEMVDFTNSIIEHAALQWNKVMSSQTSLKDPSAIDGSNIPHMGSTFRPGDILHAAASQLELASRTAEGIGVIARRIGSNAPLRGLADASFDISNGLERIAQTLHRANQRFER